MRWAASSDSSGGIVGLALAVAVIVVGAMLLRRGEPDGVAVTATTDQSAAAAPAVGVADTQPQVVVRRPRRPPSPLGWYTVGAALVAIGLAAVVANVTDATVDPGQFFGLVLGVIGIGLIVGTWWGHARLLIVLGLLLLPFAWAASLIDVPFEGGWGTLRFSPTTVEEVRDEYRLAGGQIVLDLTRMESDEPIPITASVAMGQIFVQLPEDAGLELDAAVGGGQMRILGVNQEGIRVEDHQVVEGDGPQFVLDLEAGLGDIWVQARQTENR